MLASRTVDGVDGVVEDVVRPQKVKVDDCIEFADERVLPVLQLDVSLPVVCKRNIFSIRE